MKKQKAVRMFQLFGGVIITLFLAGILVPSLMGFTRYANHNVFPGSLHTMKIAGIAFKYKLQNIVAALMGTLCGAVMTLIKAYRTATKKNTGSPAGAQNAAGDAGLARLAGIDPASSSQWLGGLFALLKLGA